MILLPKSSHICLHVALYAFTAAQECKDANENCKFWAASGECKVNPGYMNLNCRVSCDTCDQMGVLISEEDKLLMEEVAKYGERQKVEGQHSAATIEVILKTVDYMTNKVLSLPTKVISECTNDDELCAMWSALGECTTNPEFMSITCGPSCQNCGEEVIPPCPPPGVVPSIQPGKLNEFFERIVDNAPGNSADVTKGMTNYTVYVHSRPGINNAGGNVARDMQQPPWIISLDNFLTEEECKTLIQLGQKAGSRHGTTEVQLDRSLASLEMNQEQILSSVWCSYQNNCRGEDIPQLVHDRIAKITGVPVGNSEDFQMTQHEQGQFDNLHHDFVEMHRDLRCGPRLLTFQLYLSDDVEGGETTFPHWQIAVKPKAGRALLWPNVLSSDLKQSDVRMAHASKSVTKGKNFVATAHLHMYEFVDLPCGV